MSGNHIKLYCYVVSIALLSSVPLLYADQKKTNTPLALEDIKSSNQARPATNNWLQDAESDAERFKKLEVYLRGFDQPMWEVGERYRNLYHAIKYRNWELANYQWKKIKRTVNTGLMKRPKRAQNAKTMFLESVWPKLDKSINSQDYKLMKEDFMTARQACMNCHIAEKVGFVNNQALFSALTFNKH